MGIARHQPVYDRPEMMRATLENRVILRLGELTSICLAYGVEMRRTAMKDTFRLFFGSKKIVYHARSGVVQAGHKFLYDISPAEAVSLVIEGA